MRHFFPFLLLYFFSLGIELIFGGRDFDMGSGFLLCSPFFPDPFYASPRSRFGTINGDVSMNAVRGDVSREDTSRRDKFS